MKLRIAPVAPTSLLPYEDLARQHGTSVRAHGNLYAPTTHYLAAFDEDADNALVGFGGMRYLPDRDIVSGRSFFVMPEYRRQNVAMTLWYLLMRSCAGYVNTKTIYHGLVNPDSPGGSRMMQRFDMDYVGRIGTAEQWDFYRLPYHALTEMFPDDAAFMACEYAYTLAEPNFQPYLIRETLPNGQPFHRTIGRRPNLQV